MFNLADPHSSNANKFVSIKYEDENKTKRRVFHLKSIKFHHTSINLPSCQSLEYNMRWIILNASSSEEFKCRVVTLRECRTLWKNPFKLNYFSVYNDACQMGVIYIEGTITEEIVLHQNRLQAQCWIFLYCLLWMKNALLHHLISKLREWCAKFNKFLVGSFVWLGRELCATFIIKYFFYSRFSKFIFSSHFGNTLGDEKL